MATYTVLQLITRAYYLSQVVARELQEVSGAQITDGLYLLNALLDFKGSDVRLIPYFSETEFYTVATQELYFIPNLLYIDSATFNIGTVRYPMTDMSRKQYFATGRVDNVYSLPFSYRPERVLGGMNLFLYFPPDQPYLVKIWGKFELGEVDLTTDLSLSYDGFYIEYLRYALAEYICSEWGTTFPDASRVKYNEIRKKLMDVSPPDLTIQKSSYFTRQPGYDWQIVNLSKGWLPF